MESDDDLTPLLPLSEATFFILLSLAPGPRHGYAILKEVDQMSHGRIRFSTGTLYGALKRLLDQEWIVRSGEGDEDEAETTRTRAETTRTRKEYALTARGRRALRLETNRMAELVHLAAADRSQGV